MLSHLVTMPTAYIATILSSSIFASSHCIPWEEGFEKEQKKHRFQLWMFLSRKQLILENIYNHPGPSFPLFDLFDSHRSAHIALKRLPARL